MDVGVLRPGSDAHKREVCRMFHETFNPYRPSVIAWPKLSPTSPRDVAVHTESRARLRFAVYANSIGDPQVRSAAMLNAREESRHKEVLAKLVEAYAIPLASDPPFRQPRDPEGAYLVTGYSECIDSFFAFGLPLRRIRCAAFASNDGAGAGQVCALCHKTLDTENASPSVQSESGG